MVLKGKAAHIVFDNEKEGVGVMLDKGFTVHYLSKNTYAVTKECRKVLDDSGIKYEITG
ncbi:MAG: hypothetical protein KGH60_04550 [Candidatus Micrarchaeota archaeon]|nr:hypothetical protein [Candidatus Micrarchaeota archaeon]